MVAWSVGKRAGERPDVVGRSLSPWASAAWARPLVRDGVVEASSPQTVQRMLGHHQLQPWRPPRWLAPQVPRDAAVAAPGPAMAPWDTRPVESWARVRCVDEPTRLPPRTRPAPTWAAHPGQPVRVEHEDTRPGALHLWAGCDPRTGPVDATTAERQRQGACIACLEPVERESAQAMTTVQVGLDHGRMPKGTQGQAWWATHPRFVLHLPPVPCSWMKQSAQWCSLVQRTRWQSADVADKKPRAERLLAFVAAWHEQAHHLRWSTQSVAKVMAKCENLVAKAA